MDDPKLTDEQMVADLLGRAPQGDYEVILRRPNGWPVVLLNSPLLHSGRPMPTRYWLVDRQLNKSIGRLESTGTIDQVEALVDPAELAKTHRHYQAERDAALPGEHDGPAPSGGVGGTRIGVKCLHAHYAYFLVGGNDPVGRWVDEQLRATGDQLPFDYVSFRSQRDKQRHEESEPSIHSDQPEGQKMRVAIVELGSGSTKLLITGGRSQSNEVTRVIKTNLAAGMAKKAILGDEALQAVSEALRQYQQLIDSDRVDTVVAIGSEAVRQAANADELGRRVNEVLGVELRIIDGISEAEASLDGAMHGRDLKLPVVMIDIGSASTEFAIADADGSRFVSLPIGGRTIRDQFLESDPPKPEELSAALSVIELHLEDVRRELRGFALAIAEGCVVLGPGALTEVAAVELGLGQERSVDGFVLERDAAEDVFRTLATESRHDRSHNPGLKPEHVDDVVGALCILVEFFRQFGAEEILVSEHGLRHGLAFELIEPR